MTLKFSIGSLRALCIATGLCLAGSVQATMVNTSSDGSNTVTVSEETDSTSTPLSPTLFGLFPVTPTYGTSGTAYAYEGIDEFDRAPEDKVNVNSGLGGNVVSAKSTTDTASTSANYGNNFSLTDSAYAEARFTGTPLGPGINAGPVSTQFVTAISASMATKAETQQQGAMPAYASARIVDPFHFSGLTGNEQLSFSSVLDAGMTFALDSGGAATGQELRRTFDASIEIGGIQESLYSLVIAVGITSGGLPDMVVDFLSNSLLGIDDSAVKQAILDGFAFNAATNTFTLMTDIVLYDGLIPLDNGVSEFTLAFNSGVVSDPVSQYAHLYGPGSSVSSGAVAVPFTLPLLLSGLPLLVYSGRTRRRG